MEVKISVVIPVYNNWWLTHRCLRALDRLRDQTATPFETIVVDNASSDETPQEIARFPWVRYLRQERNLNFSGGCNAGARAAQAPVVLFLNNDAMPLGDAFTPLGAALRDEQVAIAGGLLLFEDGVTQAAGMVVLPNAHWWLSERNLPAALPTVTESKDVIGVTGAAMAVRREWFLAAGGFDEGFINGFEDTDLCMRAREAGYRVRYVADAMFKHYEGATPTRYDRESHNELRFHRRWSATIAHVARTARGSIGAFSIARGDRSPAVYARALDDLLEGIRSFGHPIVEGAITPWQRLDRRFREAARLEWLAPASPTLPGVYLRAHEDSLATLATRGALEIAVPWLPAISPDAVSRCAVRGETERTCGALAVHVSRANASGIDAVVAAVDALRSSDPSLRAIVLGDRSDERTRSLARRFGAATEICDLLERGHRAAEPVDFAVVSGLTDPCAYGNGLLSLAGIACVALDGTEIRRVLDDDVAWLGNSWELAALVRRAYGDHDERRRLSRLAVRDARHRFAPRRSAMRVIDLARAARFGLERPAPAIANAPFKLPA